MSEQSPKNNIDNLNQTVAGTSDNSTEKATEKEFLDSIRQNIDAVDCEIQTLINDRAKLAQQVAIVKKNNIANDASADNSNPIFYRPEREAQVLKAVMQRNAGPIADEKMARLFREIMS
ncbi:MAG: chorismate mutase, partial [Psychrobacter sp.]